VRAGIVKVPSNGHGKGNRRVRARRDSYGKLILALRELSGRFAEMRVGGTSTYSGGIVDGGSDASNSAKQAGTGAGMMKATDEND